MRQIKDFPNYYITEDGKVWSNNKHEYKIPHINNSGYLRVGLYKNGFCFNAFIHRLVAEAFIPNPNNLPCVNHKDENKLNNNVNNLEWCDYIYNLNYGNRNEAANHTRGKPVQCIETNQEYWSASEASRQTGIAISHICDVCNGKLKTAGKLHWKWI